MANIIWEFEIQIVPVVIAFVIFQMPSFLHKLKRQYYIPIYFSIFPFSIMNQNLSKYLAEEYLGEEMTDLEAEKFRNHFIVISTISVLISIVVIPSITGFLCAFFLTTKTLFQFLAIMLIFKIATVTKSIFDFHKHSIATAANVILLSVIYFFYVGMVIFVINATYFWTKPFIVDRDWSGLLFSVGDFIFIEVGMKGILLAIVTIAFTSMVTNRDVRKENIGKVESWKDRYND